MLSAPMAVVAFDRLKMCNLHFLQERGNSTRCPPCILLDFRFGALQTNIQIRLLGCDQKTIKDPEIKGSRSQQRLVMEHLLLSDCTETQ